MGNSNLNFFSPSSKMRVLFAIALIFCFAYVYCDQPALETFLIGKAADKKFSCLMSALGKIEEASEVEKDIEDWSLNLTEGVQQGIDLNTLLLQYQYLNQVERDSIKSCGLSLGRAMERCKSVYRD